MQPILLQSRKQASNHRIRIRKCRCPPQRVSLIIRLPTLNIGRSNPSNDRTKPTDPTDRHQRNWHCTAYPPSVLKTSKEGCQRKLYFLLIRYLTPKSALTAYDQPNTGDFEGHDESKLRTRICPICPSSCLRLHSNPD